MCVELQQREHGTQTGVGRGFPEEVMPVLNLGHIADNQAGGQGKGQVRRNSIQAEGTAPHAKLQDREECGSLTEQ